MITMANSKLSAPAALAVVDPVISSGAIARNAEAKDRYRLAPFLAIDGKLFDSADMEGKRTMPSGSVVSIEFWGDLIFIGGLSF